MRPIDIRDPASPLGLTYGQELQDRIEQDRIERELESLERPSPEVLPSDRTVKNLQRRGRVIE